MRQQRTLPWWLLVAGELVLVQVQRVEPLVRQQELVQELQQLGQVLVLEQELGQLQELAQEQELAWPTRHRSRRQR